MLAVAVKDVVVHEPGQKPGAPVHDETAIVTCGATPTMLTLYCSCSPKV